MALLPPTPAQLKRMELELSQPDEVTKRDLQLLKEWLAKQPHLPKHLDDARLERFLYSCKFSLERTKRVLDKYFMVRAVIPEFFTHRDPSLPEMQEWFKHVSVCTLPSLTPEGYRVTIARLDSPDMDMTHFDVAVLFKWMLLALDARLREEKCLNNYLIGDMKGLTMTQYALCWPTLPVNRKALLSVQEAYPGRVARLHLINTPAYVDKLVKLFSPFFKEKLVKRLVLHVEGGECLQEYYPKVMLPFDYGGDAGTIDELSDNWKRKLMDLKPWFSEEERLSKSDESKRPVNREENIRSIIDPICGVSGSFRHITID